jgi:hypothetical protein
LILSGTTLSSAIRINLSRQTQRRYEDYSSNTLARFSLGH